MAQKQYQMRSILFFLLISISSLSFGQTSTIVKLKDGRSVLLKSDFTWEYIEIAEEKSVPTPSLTEAEIEAAKPALPTSKSCVPPGFQEPKPSLKIQSYLKRGRATLSHIKKRIAKDYRCAIDDITLLSLRESKQKGTYTFCACGETVRYKRLGFTINKRINVKL